MRGSEALYDSLASTYDDHFAVAHRRAYDDLAWEMCSSALPSPPATVVDVGCGVGRWAQRLLAGGYQVVGIEPAPKMAAQAQARLSQRFRSEFTLMRGRVEDVAIPAASVDAILAMGSLQYAEDPAGAVRRAAGWLRPGGVMCVLVDSLQALVVELLAAGRTDEAFERMRTRRGVWRVQGLEADLHLLDAATLTSAVEASDMNVVRIAGLLVGASVYGREGLNGRLTSDYDTALAQEYALALQPELADLGKQLLIVGRSPSP